jgi:hypothetical protein
MATSASQKPTVNLRYLTHNLCICPIANSLHVGNKSATQYLLERDHPVPATAQARTSFSDRTQWRILTGVEHTSVPLTSSTLLTLPLLVKDKRIYWLGNRWRQCSCKEI